MLDRRSLTAVLTLGLTCACGPNQREASPLTAEQQRLRDEGGAIYDRVGWTYQHRASTALVQQLLQRHADLGRVMGQLPVEPSMTVADVGAGVGWFTFHLADAVGPEGSVLALDIQPEAVAVIRARATDPEVNPHGNVEARLSRVDDCELDHDSVDLIFLAHLGFYLHRELLDENVRWLDSLARALGSDGKLVVLEYIPPAHTAKYLVPHFEGAGFVLESSQYFNHHQSWLYTFDSPRQEQGI